MHILPFLELLREHAAYFKRCGGDAPKNSSTNMETTVKSSSKGCWQTPTQHRFKSTILIQQMKYKRANDAHKAISLHYFITIISLSDLNRSQVKKRPFPSVFLQRPFMNSILLLFIKEGWPQRKFVHENLHFLWHQKGLFLHINKSYFHSTHIDVRNNKPFQFILMISAFSRALL